MPVERSAQLILLLLYLCFTWIGGVDSRYGSTADQGRTGRKDSSSRLWRPARAPGTHAKQSPSTGHSAVGLRQAGKEVSPDAEATFHRASCTLGNQVVVLRTALLFVRSAVRLVYAELPGPVAVCSPKQALCELGDRVLGGDRIVEHRRVQRAPPPTAHCPTEPPPPRSTRPDPKQTSAPAPTPTTAPDRVDEAGSVTLRVAGRPHHIGVGRTHARTRVLILVHDLNIRIIKATTGELLRDLILHPTCDYQPTGAPKVALIAPPTPRPPTSIGTGIWPNRSRNAGSRNSV